MEEEGRAGYGVGSSARRYGTTAPSAPPAAKMQPPLPEYPHNQLNMAGPPPPYTAPQEMSKDPNALAGWLQQHSLQRVHESLTANGCYSLQDLFELVRDMNMHVAK